jgi:hypothetical protein
VVFSYVEYILFIIIIKINISYSNIRQNVLWSLGALPRQRKPLDTEPDDLVRSFGGLASRSPHSSSVFSY